MSNGYLFLLLSSDTPKILLLFRSPQLNLIIFMYLELPFLNN